MDISMAKEKVPPKVKAMYDAVRQLLEEGCDVNEMKVADITNRAGIGKGTAYEYFDNKEQIISGALLYHISSVCGYLKEETKQYDNLSEVVACILDYLEKIMQEGECFIKFVHILTDSSSLSRRLQEKIVERNQETCMPGDLIGQIIRIGTESGEINKSLPYTYLSMVIIAKVLMYVVYLTGMMEENDCGKEEMRQLIYRSILSELNGNFSDRKI